MAVILLISSLLVCMVQGSEHIVDVNCQVPTSITSPNYPGRYPVKADEKWTISAPGDRRILVTFNEFMLDNSQNNDYLLITDMMDEQNALIYKGNNRNPPPFVSLAHSANIEFHAIPKATSKGFNLTVSCYQQEESTLSVRLVNGDTPDEGFLQISSANDPTEWRRICGANLQGDTAATVCRELGYPGVQKISYSEEACQRGNGSLQHPVCSDYNFRLMDCSSHSTEECVANSSVRIQCHKPSYEGCSNLDGVKIPDSFSVSSIAECVSHCRMVVNTSVALIDGSNCTCSGIDVLHLGLQSNESRCTDPTNMEDLSGTRVSSWKAVYNTLVGFCQTLDEVANGEWDSKITWFGSTVRLRCHDGYAVNGSDSIQCIPGMSTYQPIWSAPIPSCFEIPTTEVTTCVSTAEMSQTAILEGNIYSTALINPKTTIRSEENVPAHTRKWRYITISVIVIGSGIATVIILLLRRRLWQLLQRSMEYRTEWCRKFAKSISGIHDGTVRSRSRRSEDRFGRTEIGLERREGNDSFEASEVLEINDISRDAPANGPRIQFGSHVQSLSDISNLSEGPSQGFLQHKVIMHENAYCPSPRNSQVCQKDESGSEMADLRDMPISEHMDYNACKILEAKEEDIESDFLLSVKSRAVQNSVMTSKLTCIDVRNPAMLQSTHQHGISRTKLACPYFVEEVKQTLNTKQIHHFRQTRGQTENKRQNNDIIIEPAFYVPTLPDDGHDIQTSGDQMINNRGSDNGMVDNPLYTDSGGEDAGDLQTSGDQMINNRGSDDGMVDNPLYTDSGAEDAGGLQMSRVLNINDSSGDDGMVENPLYTEDVDDLKIHRKQTPDDGHGDEGMMENPLYVSGGPDDDVNSKLDRNQKDAKRLPLLLISPSDEGSTNIGAPKIEGHYYATPSIPTDDNEYQYAGSDSQLGESSSTSLENYSYVSFSDHMAMPSKNSWSAVTHELSRIMAHRPLPHRPTSTKTKTGPPLPLRTAPSVNSSLISQSEGHNALSLKCNNEDRSPCSRK